MRLTDYFDKEGIIEGLRAFAITIIVAVTSYFESTYTFVIALFISFAMNILAGFRADEVRMKLKRLLPPIVWFENFNGNKFKDSLAEFALILIVIYSIKSIFDLMGIDGSSVVAVQTLMGIAIYVYFRNSLRNLKTVYPKILFFKILYAFIALKFKELFGDTISDIVEKEEKNESKSKRSRTDKKV